MWKDIVAVEYVDGYRLLITFEDDTSGVVDISEIVDFNGVFEPLQNIEYFRLVAVNEEVGTICWPNEADLDPLVLYALVTGKPLQELLPESTQS